MKSAHHFFGTMVGAHCVRGEGTAVPGASMHTVAARYQETPIWAYLPGTIVIRTHEIHKKVYITLFSMITFGPDYYVPP